MNKTVLIIAVVAGLGLIGAGAYYFLSRSKTVTPATSSQQTATSETRSATLSSLLGLGINQECTFQDSESGSQGMMYLGDGQARGDFMTTSGDSQEGSHMIVDETNMYVWMDTGEEGYKMARSSLETVQENLPESGPKTIDVNKQVDYECSPWSVDASMFTPPTNITFTDYSSMMESAGSMMKAEEGTEEEQDSKAACSQCDSLPQDAQAQCRQVLGC